MRIPFQASINVTYTAGPGQPDDVIYMIVSVPTQGLTPRLCNERAGMYSRKLNRA
jgi:hypothetical protein